ncbi:MAG: nickel pincer cofactor biosynthesis protein LarB [Verrucomicrobia bacterium]|nr:nickel pincer cofactor biosynthesis protein LarB [Verrucomicrobiota bacterium]MBT5063425.1 nickel pincer cofactor biosynthesis protein LarB [Verrucomicrobiota bacterium]MBT5479997.1 nickel pincer cofactor biosynthesis protein LarB [Verrucomicrobiota bacterium]MBT6239202.1 nickel pincer cofactor biosynthesis protein LarB [Verrucomicrobiota bacterium]MBT6804850.1 nickel pincer cofactor biosynthesis protein LarB [Verrucomicrobiota bacterium]
MTSEEAGQLLDQFQNGAVSRENVLRSFQQAPFVDMGFAKVDTHRALRKGFAEVIFGQGKTDEQILSILQKISESSKAALVTRISAPTASFVQDSMGGVTWHPLARCLVWQAEPVKITLGKVCVVSAGTSDLPVAEEAAVTAEVMGNEVDRVYDVGVAGLHRILGQLDRLQSANVVIVAAGMEGALPSVVAGLVAQPVIAVPTSIGYGASFQGVAALLGMLNSCGSGVTVVNIDNGFGAAYAASQINMMITKQSRDQKHIQHA